MTSPRHRGPGHPHADETAEKALERYIVRGPSLRERFARRLEHAPWWAISATVHAIVLVILWLWPMPGTVVGEERAVVIKPFTPPEREAQDLTTRPQPPKPNKLPTDFKINHSVRQFEPKALELAEPALGKPDEPQARAPRLELRPPLIAVSYENLPAPGPSGQNPLGKRPASAPRGSLSPGGESPAAGVPSLSPVMAGLVWLAKAQLPDGGWDATLWGGDRPYRVGMTGLAVLAFEGCGFTHVKGPLHKTVARALEWLARSQRSDGSFPFETFYEHGIAAMAVAEAYAMTGDIKLRPMAQAAVNYICRTQPAHGGFRYGGAVPKAAGDMSVTGWQIMALKSAKLADLAVPRVAIERCHTFLGNTLREYGASAYLAGRKESGSLAMTSVGMASRCFLNELHCYDDEILRAADLLRSKEVHGSEPTPGGASGQLVKDLYYTYYSSLAMAQVGGEYWREWRKLYYKPLENAQVHQNRDAKGRYIKGSWDPQNHRWGKRGGRVYSTAMAVLALEAPYRFLQLYRVSR